MTPTTRSSSNHETLLQANETLLHALTQLQETIKNMNDELMIVKNAVQELRQNTLVLNEKTNDIDKKIDSLDLTNTERMDNLCLQTGDIAVELEQLQQKTQAMTTDLDNIQSVNTPSQTLINSINSVIDTKFQNIPSIVKHEIQTSSIIQNLQTHQTPSSTKTQKVNGFHQSESKEFHVSKLIKLLETHTLNGDSLQDLELFYDTIITHLSTVTLKSNLLPTYRNLSPTFCFKDHLCSSQINPTLLPADLHQAKLNYKTFGTGIRQFIINPKTVPQTTAPESYLQLISLKHEQDGFLLLQNFIFLRSPQLEGKFIDYRKQIIELSSTPNEPLRSFYSRAMHLYNELILANIKDGSITVLIERFLHILRSTGFQFIIAETSFAWKTIQEHRRNPKHVTTPPALTLNSILRDLETAGITNIPAPITTHMTTPDPIICSADTQPLLFTEPVVAYTNENNRPQYNINMSRAQQNTNQLKHNPSITNPIKQNQPKCRLCNNQHPNPWHTTDSCPFKDPTYIQNKLIRENVMQHNTLFGCINKNYTKDMDTSNNNTKPIRATLPRTVKHAEDNPLHQIEDNNHPNQSDLIDLTEHPQYNIIPNTSQQQNHENTSVLSDQPNLHILPDPCVHSGLTNHLQPNTNTLITETFQDDTDFFFDPNQYQYFAS